MKIFQATIGNRAYPPDTGGYQRTHGLMSSFPEYGDSVYRYCCTGPLAVYYAEKEFIEREVQIAPGFVENRQYSVLHDIPKLVGLIGYTQFAWPAVFRTCAGTALVNEATGYDIATADDPYLARFIADSLDIPTVYSSHNVEYKRYQSTTKGRLAEFFGNQLQTVEQQACARVDLVVCTTEADQEVFSEHAQSTVVVPNGIAADVVTADVQPADRTQYGIPANATIAVFLGSDYRPNVEAAKWLSENWHDVDESTHLVVLGSAGNKVDDSAENIHTTGYVEDLQAALAMADVALNPIFSGGGSNVKLAEYFAASLPVVSTPFGARGFDVGDGEHLLLAEREEFFDALGRLAAEGELRESLGTAGHRLIRDRYTWEALSRQLRTEFHELVSARTGA